MELENKLHDKFVQRIEDDYYKAIQNVFDDIEGNETEVDCAIRNAYPIACYNEVYAFFVDLTDYDDFDHDDLLEKVLNNPNKNVIEFIWENWKNYNHPERYNFFANEVLWDIIVYALELF